MFDRSQKCLVNKICTVLCSIHLGTRLKKHWAFVPYTHVLCSNFVNLSIKILEYSAKMFSKYWVKCSVHLPRAWGTYLIRFSPVVPGDCNITSEPLRGYALEIAQRQGRNKRKLRKLLKKCFFQFIHLWMVLSICLTSYESNMATVKKNFESRLATGSSGFDSVNRFVRWILLYFEHEIAEIATTRVLCT